MKPSESVSAGRKVRLFGPVLNFCLHSRVLARVFEFRKPAILLLSYPRSGSSWIGQVLARSPDVAYLREPINQGYHSQISDGKTPLESVFDPAESESGRELYVKIADDAFRGIPPRGIADVVESESHFLPLSRRSRRPLIKEINPLAAELLIRRYSPFVVLLLRHPAAVADSYHRLGWMNGQFEAMGREYGTHLARANRALEACSHVVVRCEDLSVNPMSEFEQLFDRMQVRPPADLKATIHEFCESGQETRNPYQTRRSSRFESEKWRRNLKEESISEIKRGYMSTNFGYYRESADWGI